MKTGLLYGVQQQQKETLCDNFITSSNLEPSLINSLIILEGFSEMINSIKLFDECVSVYLCILSLFLSFPTVPLPSPQPATTHTQSFNFSKTVK